MKLLFDQNLSHRLCGLLADISPTAAQVRGAGLDRATRVVERLLRDNASAIDGFLVDDEAACLEIY